MTENERALQAIPSVDKLLKAAPFQVLAKRWRRDGLRNFLQIRLADYRRAIVAGEHKGLSRDEFLSTLPRRWAAEWKELCLRGTRRVINATGVCLHTNLGRATLSAGARKAAATAARWPVDLELDLASGKRASRVRKLEELLRIYSASPAAFAVNNNAAALTLVVDTLARKRRLIVSRGEQVEIGGSFRLPEILERFAGKMVEVGTTNRTRLSDYARAITRKGDVLLKVHRSNFSQQGYVQETSLTELVELGRERDCPVVYDLGSGRYDDGMDWLKEPTFADALAAAPDIISFSGDKVFGGPQAGILLGDATVMKAIRENPLARALRLDKLSLAALIETIAARLEKESELPTRSVLSRKRGEIRALAETLANDIKPKLPKGTQVQIITSEARSGGGAAAESCWPSAALKVACDGKAASRLSKRLRDANPAVLGLVRPEGFILDMAAIDAEEIPALGRALLAALKQEAGR